MLHKLKQIDSGFWEVDDYTIQKEYVVRDLGGADFWIGYTLSGEQVTDKHTTFEGCLGELIFIIEVLSFGGTE